MDDLWQAKDVTDEKDQMLCSKDKPGTCSLKEFLGLWWTTRESLHRSRLWWPRPWREAHSHPPYCWSSCLSPASAPWRCPRSVWTWPRGRSHRGRTEVWWRSFPRSSRLRQTPIWNNKTWKFKIIKVEQVRNKCRHYHEKLDHFSSGFFNKSSKLKFEKTGRFSSQNLVRSKVMLKKSFL